MMNGHSNHQSRTNRNLLWGGLLVLLGLLFLMNQLMPGRFFGSLIAIAILGGIGATFFVVYLTNRQQWWALIPAYVFWAITGIVFLSDIIGIGGNLMGAYVMFAIAAPFIYVYGRNRQHWWALIPGGIMAAIGAGLLLDSILPIIPALMIVGGIYLVVRNLDGQKAPKMEPIAKMEPIVTVAKTGPEADQPRP
jgi:hypothetical protein